MLKFTKKLMFRSLDTMTVITKAGLIEELSLYVWYTIHDCPLHAVPRCTDDLK